MYVVGNDTTTEFSVTLRAMTMTSGL